MEGLKSRSSFVLRNTNDLHSEKGSSLVLSVESSRAMTILRNAHRTVNGLSIRITLYNYYFDMCKNIHLLHGK